MQRALGKCFQLLTPESVPELIGSAYLNRSWGFKSLKFKLAPDIKSIVARSDFIRMAYVYQHGGVWIDADTLMLNNPTVNLFPDGLSKKLHWYSEVLFGSLPGNPILGEAVTTSLGEHAHGWGDPGGIKKLVEQMPDQLMIIPSSVVDPGYRPRYNFVTCNVMRQRDISVGEFLVSDINILKLYNTYFTRTTNKQQSVEEFLAGGTLLAKLFLHIEPSPQYWISKSSVLIEQCDSRRGADLPKLREYL